VRTPIRFSGQSLDASAPPPLLGEQSANVLSTVLGMSADKIAGLIDKSIILQSG